MCGIAGFREGGANWSAADLQSVAREMCTAIEHRGPDDFGEWIDAEAGIALGSRRLSVIDLSPEGHQPMTSESGRYVIVFNGEIYNHLSLREELDNLGHRFRGRSDTEVMLAAFEQWGVASALQRFNGMVAFALWDRKERLLQLARDRIGKKPLYYGWVGPSFIFASELKAFRPHPAFRGEIHRDVLALYLRFGYVPAPHSIYQGIYKLQPGTLLTISSREAPGEKAEHFERYWSARALIEKRGASSFRGSPEEATEELEELLRDAVRIRMLSDVPLGALLSGGIDSSTIVALMQLESSQPIRTFTIGFHDKTYNEAEAAKAVARHLGTDHTELYATPKEALDVIPRLPALYDEPFADSSQIPTFLVSDLARRHVTVCLSGDGGDEMFGGYMRYLWGGTLWRSLKRVPLPLRRLGSSAMHRVSPRVWEFAYRTVEPVLPARWRQSLPADKARKFAEFVAVASPAALYLRLVSQWPNSAGMVVGAKDVATPLDDCGLDRILPDVAERMMFLDMITYLPDDILVKVDRASMGASLEARCPFLDHRVVEWAWRLPLDFRLRAGKGKWLLRRVLDRYVPKELVERPKMGFGIPLDSWLRGPLREWAEELLDEARLRREGYLRPEPIRKLWLDHLSGHRNEQHRLWTILIFQAWKEAWAV